MIYLNQAQIRSDQFPNTDFYPFNLSVFHQTGGVQFDHAVTFFTGENGSGKSTLLRAIASQSGIHIWDNDANVRCDNNPYETDLYQFIRLQWQKGPVNGSFFSSRIFSDFSRNLEEWALNDAGMLDYYGGKSLITQSHGQSLMSYFTNRYAIKGLYFLDEPETALSPKSLIQLVNLLAAVGTHGQAQFIVATHSPFLLACPESTIYSFDTTGISTVPYKESEYYRLYMDFLHHPERYITSG